MEWIWIQSNKITVYPTRDLVQRRIIEFAGRNSQNPEKVVREQKLDGENLNAQGLSCGLREVNAARLRPYGEDEIHTAPLTPNRCSLAL